MDIHGSGSGYSNPSEARPESWVRDWLFTTDHKKIGIWYFATAFFFFLLAGSIALMIRTQLILPNMHFLDAAQYSEAFSLHGFTMMLFFLTPWNFAFGNYFVPLQVGTKRLAFPKLESLAYWLYLLGGILLFTGLYYPGGALNLGWTLYAPLNQDVFFPNVGDTIALFALMMELVSLIIAALNFIVTIVGRRAKGMRMVEVPLFTWAILFVSVLLWFSAPELLGLDTTLILDRVFHFSTLLSPAGGALLWELEWWYFGHPEVYVLVLPAAGAIADMTSTFAKRPVWGKKMVIGAFGFVLFMSILVFFHHMFMTGILMPMLQNASVWTETISIPVGVIWLAIVGTVVGGKINAKNPAMLFIIGAGINVLVGGTSGELLSAIGMDVGVHGTFFVVGHFHYFVVGLGVFGLIAATYYWFPKMTGFMLNRKLGVIHFIISYIGINLLYGPMFFLYNMPRRWALYPPGLGFTTPNFMASIGAYIFGGAQVILLVNMIYTLYRQGPKAPDNPWGGYQPEWLTTSPPPEHNFDGLMNVKHTKEAIKITFEPLKKIYKPELSPYPLIISVGAFIFFTGVALYVMYYPPIVWMVGAAIVAYGFIGWMYQSARLRDYLGEDVHERNMKGFSGINLTDFGMFGFITGFVLFFSSFLGTGVFGYLQTKAFSILGAFPFSNDPPLALGSIMPHYQMAAATILAIVSTVGLGVAYEGAKLRKYTAINSGLGAAAVMIIAVVVMYLSSFAIMGTDGYGFAAAHNSMLLSTFYDNFIPLTAFFVASAAVAIYMMMNALRKKITMTPRITSMRALLIFNTFTTAFAVIAYIVVGAL